MTTRRQHYVWRKYLRAWAPNDQIWCVRDGSPFYTNLMNVAQERDFYKLHDLTVEEAKFLQDFCSVQREPLRTTNLRWVEIFTALFDLQRKLVANGCPPEEIKRAIDQAAVDQEEKFHTEIEQGAIDYLNALLLRDASFYNRTNDKVGFIHFLCVQYTRTKKLKSNALEGPSRLTAVNPENIWNVLSHIIATSLGQNLIAYSYQLYFLRPEGEERFITGDQPVINPHGTYTSPNEAPKELDLYYPISPELAILVASEPPENSLLTDDEIKIYNRHIQLYAHSQLFAHDASALEPYRKHSE